jgi:DNA processing protein
MLYKTITLEDSMYPPLLREVQNPPRKLYIKGELSYKNLIVAIVGTRKASESGIKLAHLYAKSLVEAGYSIISGLALGIDTAAHKGALDSSGVTIAVLGNSIDSIYPPQNKELSDKIIQKGAIISEYGPGETIAKRNFLERNRIISGMSIATIVIEAPSRSGAIATARLAGEQGRDVFVVPGSVDDPNYEGSNSLIRDGAILVRSIKDVIEDIRIPNTLFDK